MPESRVSGRPAARGIAALAVAALVLFAPGAQAGEIVGELDAAGGAGVTDNARYTPTNKVSDALLVAMGAGRLRYRGPRWNHSLGYQIAGTWYVQDRGPSGYNQNAAWQTTGILSPKWTLALSASGTYAQTTVFDSVDVRTVNPQLTPLGITKYMSGAVSQALVYEPNARRKFGEAFMFSKTHILETPPMYNLPDSTLVTGNLRGEQQLSIDQINADLTGSYVSSVYANGQSQNTKWILLQALVGWRRDLNPQWSVEARVGVVGVFLIDGIRGLVAPAFQLSAVYKRERWFANAMVAQTATPNIFGGAATISDVALVRAALPLTRSERFYFMGFGSYMYGRTATRAGSTHVFDNRTLGASLTARTEKAPYWASLDYMFTDQVFLGGPVVTDMNGVMMGGDVPLRRNVIMLNVGGSFIFGKGQPSPFRGVL